MAQGLGERQFGEIVTDGRSSWVRKALCPVGEIYVKTYEYSTWVDRLRPTWRSTGPWRRSRAAAEFDALAWMQGHQIPSARPLAVWEQRQCGWLCRAMLLTAAWPGQPLATWLEKLTVAEARPLAAAVGSAVARLHTLGFRDRNLDARNLLAASGPHGDWLVAKIDSPRHFLRQPGPPADRAAAADWRRLLPQIQPPELRKVALASAAVPEWQQQWLLTAAATPRKLRPRPRP